jgi:hypothetical protein
MAYDAAGLGGTPAGDRSRAKSGGYDPIGTGTKENVNPDALDPRGRNQIPSNPGGYTEKVNAPIEAAPVATQRQGELLRYPIATNYGAEISFRVKSILPWDVTLNSAISILRSPLIEKGFQYVKDLVETSTEAVADNPNAAVERERARFGAMERDLNAAQAAGAAFKAAKDKNAQENAGVTTDIIGVKTKYVQEAPVVITYFPQAININDDVTYDTPELGPAGAAALGAINNGASVLGAVNSAIQEGLRGITDIFRGVNTTTAAKIALARAAQKGPESLSTAAAVGLQVKVNPNSRSVFNGVNIRQFVFQYDFIATSPTEAEQINKIVKHFRTELYPSTFGRDEASIPIGYRFPNLFEIRFKYRGQNMKMPQPLLCYLRNVQTTYNPASMSFHEDGNPVQISMTLSFQEFRAVTREDVERDNA